MLKTIVSNTLETQEQTYDYADDVTETIETEKDPHIKTLNNKEYIQDILVQI